MATLKHIASKNSDYSAIEAYLIYQHDAFTGKQLLDEQGRPMLRDSYILDTLECGDFSFATACLLANRKYNKNNHPDDIKSHQYIIRTLAPDKNGTLIFSPDFATVGRSKERAFEQKEKVHKHFPLSR